MKPGCRARFLGVVEYGPAVSSMQVFTDARQAATPDEIWLLEHYPVFTQGTSCQSLPHDNPDNIPIVHSNRGGQITYHGPGQLIAYLLLDIKRLGFGPRTLVNRLEQAVIKLLESYGLIANRRSGAPGVYIDSAKIAALGLRIRNGMCYHGLSLNVAMDLKPYELIDPCGFNGLEVTQLSAHIDNCSILQVGHDLLAALSHQIPWQGAPTIIESNIDW